LPDVASHCSADRATTAGTVSRRHACSTPPAPTRPSSSAPKPTDSAAIPRSTSIRSPPSGAPVLHGPAHSVSDSDLLVDCLLGTGSAGAPRGAVAALIETLSQASCPILACDIPSGVDADTGEVHGIAVHADMTVTLTALKPGLLLHPGAAHAGRIRVAPLGLPSTALTGPHFHLGTASTIAKLLPSRAQHRDANKGSFGKVLVVAGSRGMTGAAVLTATSALRAGAGLVWLAVPESCIGPAASLAPEIVLRPLPETPDGRHGGVGAVEKLERWVAEADALAIGPGLGQGPETADLVQWLVRGLAIPTVADADALAALSPIDGNLRPFLVPPVLTPHPGEMARLLGLKSAEIQADRLGMVQRAASLADAVVLLKGARTLIAEPRGNVHFNTEGTPALATAGSGDVLTGIVAAFLAADLPPADAARAGAFLHARAGALAAPRPFPGGALAGEIRDQIPAAWRTLWEDSDQPDDEPCLI